MNSGTIFKLCMYACCCCRSRQTQSTICNAAGCPDCLRLWEAEKRLYASIVAHCCRRCLLTLTANNVLLDDCALLKPERSQRLMKGSRKWRRMRATDADAGPCPSGGKLPKEDYTHTYEKAQAYVLYYSLSTGSPLTGGRRRWEKEKCFHCVSVGPNFSPADRVLCQEDASCWC